MTAKEYLGQVFHINNEIDENILEIEKLDSEIIRSTPTFSNITHDVQNDNKIEIKLVDYINKYNTLRNEINKKINRLADLKKEIRNRIYAIKDPKYRLILSKRYIRLLKWEQIQTEMKYRELKSVFRVRDKALIEFIKINGNCFDDIE